MFCLSYHRLCVCVRYISPCLSLCTRSFWPRRSHSLSSPKEPTSVMWEPWTSVTLAVSSPLVTGQILCTASTVTGRCVCCVVTHLWGKQTLRMYFLTQKLDLQYDHLLLQRCAVTAAGGIQWEDCYWQMLMCLPSCTFTWLAVGEKSVYNCGSALLILMSFTPCLYVCLVSKSKVQGQ